jgi:hypothetical protein
MFPIGWVDRGPDEVEMGLNRLRTRVQRLETAVGGSQFLRRKLQRFASRVGLDPDHLNVLSIGREAQLDQCIDNDGRITWEGFCLIRDLSSGGLGSPIHRH